MSLRVWLPLTGTLENKGVSDLQFSNTNTSTITVNTAGKIGSCYCRAAAESGGYIISNKTILLNGDISMCCWAKVTATDSGDTANGLITNHSHADSTGFGITVKKISDSDYRISCNTGTGSSRTYYTYYGTTNIKNEWHHLTLTYNNTTHIFQLWVDGKVEKTQSYTNGARDDYIRIFDWSTTYDSARYQPACMLNDVRIYDHCLSAAEVHEISQGLVLHYKLDDNIQTITNAFNMGSWNTNTASGGFNVWGPSGHSGSRGTNTDRQYIYFPDRSYSYWIAHGANTDTSKYYIFYQSPAFDGGYRSLSCIVKEENSLPIDDAWFMPGWNANVVGEGHAPVSTWTHKYPLGNGFYLCQVDGFYQDGSNDLVCLTVNNGHKVYISEIWLEDNRQVASNPLAQSTTMQVQDSSGYGHNGTTVGSPTLLSNSARHSSSTYLADGTVSRIVTPSLSFEPHAVTLNIWFKSTNTSPTGSYHMVVDSNANRQWYEMAVYNTGYFRGGLFVNGARKADNGTSTKCLDGNWHMLTLTYDGTNVNRYVDGVMEKATAAAYSSGLSTPTALTIGRDGPNASYAVKEASVSDFRIYCTALSADDILSLYHTSAKVDNLGGLHTYELKETGTVPQVLKKGIVQHGILREAAALNSGPTVSYKPAANASNSCATGVIVDFSEFADEGQPLTCTLNCDISWSGLAAGTGGTFRVLLQGSNRKKATNSFAWEGANYVTNGYNFTSLITANSTGSTHRTYTFTIPATWFDTYNGSYFGVRTDYANGTGTITISNIKVTVAANSFKIKSNSIQAENLIER